MIPYICGILAAFLLGAYVRRPFPLVRRKEPSKTEETKRELTEDEKRKLEQWDALLSYTGEGKRDED